MFEDHLLKHESRLVSRLEGKKYEALEELRLTQEEEIENLKIEYIDLQVHYLFPKLERLPFIMILSFFLYAIFHDILKNVVSEKYFQIILM